MASLPRPPAPAPTVATAGAGSADGDDFDFDPVLDRRQGRRRRTQGRRSLLRVLVLLLVCIGLSVAIIRVSRAIHLRAIVFGPDVATDGQTWSTREMGEFLKRKRLIRSMGDIRQVIGGEGVTVSNAESPDGGETASVVRAANDQAAYVAAEEFRRAGRPTFNWGRFYFTGDDALVTTIRKALLGY